MKSTIIEMTQNQLSSLCTSIQAKEGKLQCWRDLPDGERSPASYQHRQRQYIIYFIYYYVFWAISFLNWKGDTGNYLQTYLFACKTLTDNLCVFVNIQVFPGCCIGAVSDSILLNWREKRREHQPLIPSFGRLESKNVLPSKCISISAYIKKSWAAHVFKSSPKPHSVPVILRH